MKKNDVHGCISNYIPVVFLCLFISFISNKAFSQNSVWAGGATNTISADYGYAIKSDNSGNTYVAGVVSTTSGNFFIAKYDPEGNQLWYGSMGSSGQETLDDICIDNLGCVYITGTFAATVDFDFGAGTKTLTNSGTEDIFVAKYNSAGNCIWAYKIGNGATSGSGHMVNSIFNIGSKIYLTGATNGNLSVDFDPKAGNSSADLTPIAKSDVFFARYDTSFNYQLAKLISSSESEQGKSISADANGYIYLAGTFNTALDFNPGTAVYSLTPAGGTDIFLAKYNSSGAFVWAKKIGGADDECPNNMIYSAGILYITGYFYSASIDFNPDAGTNVLANKCGSNATTDIFYAKFDTTACTHSWAFNIGSTSATILEDDQGNSIDIDLSGNVYITGQFYGTCDFNPTATTNNLTSAGENDIFIAKFTSAGAYVWAKKFGSTTYDAGSDISIDTKGEIHLTGSFTGTDVNFGLGTDIINLTSSGGSIDWFAAKYTEQATHITTSTGTTTLTANWLRPGITGRSCIVFMAEASIGSPAPVNGTTYTASTVFKSGTQIGATGWYCVYKGTASSVNVTGLNPGTTYRIKTIEYTTSGTIFNNYDAIANPVNALTNYVEPTVQATNIIFSNVKDTSATISWTNGDGEKRAVFAQQYDSGEPVPINDHTYIANERFGEGEQIGSTNWYCVYNGSGNSFTMRNLIKVKSYRIMVCEYNGITGLEKYLKTTSANNPLTLLTENPIPATQSIDIVFSNTQDVSTTLSWTSGTGISRVVFASRDTAAYANPIDHVNYIANQTYGLGSKITNSNLFCVYNGSGNSVTVNGLSPNTIYRFQVFDYNGTSPMEKYNILTNKDNPLTRQTEYSTPSVQASGLEFSNIRLTSTTLSFKKGNGTKRAVFVIKDAIAGHPKLVDSTTYAANSKFGYGHQIGQWFCVYNGTDTFVTVTNLLKLTTYKAMVYEYNGTPGREAYNTNGTSTTPNSWNTRDTNVINDFPDLSKVYGGGYKLTAYSSANLKVTFSVSDTTVAKLIMDSLYFTKAGTTKIYARDTGDVTHVPAFDSAMLTVAKAPLTVTAKSYFKAYGDIPTSFSFNVSGLKFKDNIESVTSTCSYTISSDTGSYPITPSNAVFSLGNINNYNITYLTGKLQIIPATLTIKALDTSRVYGDSNPSFRFSATGLKLTDTINSVVLNTTAINTSIKGEYNIVPSLPVFGRGKASNYNLLYINGKLTISPASLTITAENKSRTHGSADPVFSFKHAGLKNNDSIKSVNFSSTANSSSDTGTYSIYISNPSFTVAGTETNYIVNTVEGKLKVTPSPLNITLKDGVASRSYGEQNPSFLFSATGLKHADAISSVNFNTTANIISDCGQYPVALSDAVFSTGKSKNYDISYTEGILNVNQVPITIAADSKSRTYGENNPSFTWSSTSLKNNDSIKSVSLSTTAIPRSPIGSYDIVPSSAVFEKGKISNYSINYAKGTLTVTESPIQLCLVSVDMESGYSMVVWERNNTAGLKGYNVYRQTSSVGEYAKIGNVPINKTGIFIDSTSAIERHAELYKITTIDANSVESRLDQCNYHKSLFLQYAGSVGGVNLTWQPYEIENSVVNFKSYIIYKGSDSTKLTVVDTIASNIYNYTDNDPSALVYTYYYRIAGIKYNACYPEGHRKAGAGPFLESISNMEDNKLKVTQKIRNTLQNSFDIVVNPNPVKSISAIRYILTEPSDVNAQLINMLGATVANIKVGKQPEGDAQFYLDINKYKISEGIYYLKVKAGKYESIAKISVIK